MSRFKAARFALWTAIAVCLCAAPARSELASLDDKELLRQLFSGQSLDAGWFAPDFADRVPLSHVHHVVDGIREERGVVPRVSGSSGRYYIATGIRRVPVTLHRDQQGRIVALAFHPALPTQSDLASVAMEVQALPGQVSVLITKDGEALASSRAGERLGVASAVRLAVLATLKQEIEAGRARWEESVQLEERHRSLPPGEMRKLPEAAPATLHALAVAMMAAADNTATDILIDRLGRDAVATTAGMELLATTRERFQLIADRALYQDYVQAGLSGRRALLKGLESRPLPHPAQLLRPLPGQAEWSMSAEQLCALMDGVLGLDVMRIEPGPADPERWVRVGHIAGRGAGVLSLTTSMTAPRSGRFCVSITWNDRAVLDEARLYDLYVRLLAVLPRR